MKLIAIRKYFLIVTIAFSFQNCGWLVDIAFPLEIDKFLGERFFKSVVQGENNVKVYKNQELQNYVQSITDKILKSKEIRYKDEFPYKVTLLKDDDTINAVCAPGGYIFVYTGLLHFVKNEATLAGILAHEIAHAERRHSTKQLSTSIALYYGLYLTLSYVLGSELAQHAANLAGLSTNLLSLANSRSAEEEADEFGFRYMRSTPYYPGAISEFFKDIQVWRKEQGDVQDTNLPLEKYLSTHPMDEERIAENERRLKEAKIPKPNPKSFFRERYRSKISQYLGEKAE
ncbi:peptidase M48 [Leptospira langatensis]|uniref:Peptidase M48 n=1 Tax=Leptospira langatensis TaxID=2484983 RepID=A0A5F1ZXU8_9LEPT|nr:M48 family metalloprotease [Leptospira langatensis]TGJ98591.1 peptidase M48 [Leptospira langatensis]TGL43504.1 peptidase M48 [Leptospira langatensis]